MGTLGSRHLHITTVIFLDANGDGDQTGDRGISGVTVELIQNGKVIATIVTEEDGLYTLTDCLLEHTVKLSTVPESLAETLSWTECMTVLSK